MHALPSDRPESAAPQRWRGFTLIETMIAVGIAAVLSSLAYPSLESHFLRARRTDALVALMQAQLAQERFRASNTAYGNLAQIGVRNVSVSGHYALLVTANGADGYELVASAAGRQRRDTPCQVLRLAVVGASLAYASGTDPAASNPADVNRRCWSQ